MILQFKCSKCGGDISGTVIYSDVNSFIFKADPCDNCSKPNVSRCPFCLSENTKTRIKPVEGDAVHYFIECLHCDSRGPDMASVEGAERLWGSVVATKEHIRECVMDVLREVQDDITSRLS
jgi:hypothetical protein